MAAKKPVPARKQRRKGPVGPPADLIAYIQAGGVVRNEPSDPMPGRCGALNRGKRGGHCSKGAGQSTEHQKFGRCAAHEGEYTTGLAPWIGEMPADLWAKITGARASEPGSRGVPTTHGATDGLRSYEQILASRLEPEDLEAYLSAPLNPKDILEANLRERWMAKDRIYRYLQRLRERCANEVRNLQLEMATTRNAKKLSEMRTRIGQIEKYAELAKIEVEPTLNKITGVVARLLETSARFRELEGSEDTRAALQKALGALSDEDFARMKADPVALAHLTAASVGGKTQ